MKRYIHTWWWCFVVLVAGRRPAPRTGAADAARSLAAAAEVIVFVLVDVDVVVAIIEIERCDGGEEGDGEVGEEEEGDVVGTGSSWSKSGLRERRRHGDGGRTREGRRSEM